MTLKVLDRRVFRTGDRIFHEGDPGDRAYLVQKGRVQIVKECQDGLRILGHIEPGGMFGEMALIDGAPRMAAAHAIEETVCVVINRKTLEQKLAEADPFLVALLRILLTNARSLANAA